MIFSPWARASLRGFWSGLIQVRWVLRAVMSVANCVAVSSVVRWCGNGLSWCGLRIFVAIYPQDCLPGGVVVSWWGWGVPPYE